MIRRQSGGIDSCDIRVDATPSRTAGKLDGGFATYETDNYRSAVHGFQAICELELKAC